MMHPKTQRCLCIHSFLFLSVLALTSVVLAAQSIEGVWRMVEVEVQGGPNPAVYTGAQIQPSLFILTEGHFAYLIDNSRERRPARQEPTERVPVP